MSDLSTKIQDCAYELFGNNFKFRKGQLDVIQNIIENVQTNVKQTVLEAPTGSGKSIIGIITAYVLYKHYDKTSYILTSDLSLFDQYEHDIKRLYVDCFGCIKGKENYICNDNNCNVSQSTCALQGKSIMSLAKSYGFSCKDNCQYYHDYLKAVESPITLMTYQLYFIQRNYVENDLFGGLNKNFPKRDLVIADECHKICDICQTHFAPQISIARPKWMNILDEYMNDYHIDLTRAKIIEDISNSHTADALITHVSRYESYISHYASINEYIRKQLSKKRKLTKQDKSALLAGNIARQEHCKLEDIVNFIDETNSPEYAVKTCTEDSITINFVFDNLMLKKYFHEKSNCELLMSATIGDFNDYAYISGLDTNTFKTITMKSTFDFMKSPIYFSTFNRMSYTEKSKSFRPIVMQAIDICRKFKHKRGIIQTGSYINSHELKRLLPLDILERCLFYDNSNEKNNALEMFMSYSNELNDNHILIGPTLIEGINLPNDACRFQICIKVPFAHLGNEYVKKKKDFVKGWYQYDVINKICQGVGRGIRHEADWCETYILDGCIESLVGKLNNINTLRGRFIDIVYMSF